MTFFGSRIGSEFGQPGGTPHEEFPGVPPGSASCEDIQYNRGFWILCLWNLDSGFQTLAGFQIPQAKLSWIPESGFS